MKLDFVLWIISALFLSYAQIYAWHKISNKESKIINIKNLLVSITLASFSIINFYNINPFIKSSTMIIVAIISCKILLNKSLKDSIIIVGINYLLLILGDALFGIIIIIMTKTNFNILWDKYSGGLVANTFIGLLIIIITRIDKIKELLNNIFYRIRKHTNHLKEYETLIYLLVITSCSVAAFALTYYHNNIIISIIINIMVSIIYLIIIIRIIKTKNKLISINSKYNTSLDSLHAQESIINEYRIMNHENRNNLLTIKGMTNNKKITGYINSLLKQKDTMNEKIMQDTLKLPEGGIRGLIYSKMLVMKDNNIKCNLNVDKKITVKTLANINDSDIVDICQIIGVFIDNAIDESLLISKKNINIDMHIIDKKLNIIITNYHNHTMKKFIKNSDLKTTKGDGHGYGLQFVKQIINSNSRLNNERIITKDTFTQKLEITI